MFNVISHLKPIDHIDRGSLPFNLSLLEERKRGNKTLVLLFTQPCLTLVGPFERSVEKDKETKHKLTPIAQMKHVSIWRMGVNLRNSDLRM